MEIIVLKTTNNISLTDVKTQSQGGEQQTQQTKSHLANKFLNLSTTFWFIAIMIGQWLFFYFIIAFYGFSVINDNMQIWNRWESLGSTPYKASDPTGNLMFAIHAIGAGIVAFGGALQLIPKVRQFAPRFHKINGYVYLITVLFLALSGFYLSLVRGASPDSTSAIGTSINGILILTFAYLTVKTARNRKLAQHRKWAIRLFLVSNAQWLLRVGVFSYMITGTLVGGSPAFGDPFFSIWTFACYLLPLAAAELYFYASEKGSSKLKIVTGVTLTALTVLMLIGVVGLTPFLNQLLSGGPIKF